MPAPSGEESEPSQQIAPNGQTRPWTITPYADIQEIFTDNVRLAPYSKQSDLITAITPGLGISGQTRRFSAYFDGNATYNKYVSATDLDGWGYNASGNALAELAERTLFLDLRSAISQEPVNPQGINSAVDRTLPSNQVSVFNSSASPYLQHEFGGWAVGELRYRLSNSHYANASQGPTSGLTTVPSDAVTHEGSFDIHSGQDFDRFHWGVNGDLANTHYSDDTEFRQRSILANGEYAVIREVAVLAKSGYESYTDTYPGSLSASEAGPVWLGGLRLTPGPRTTLTAWGGWRYHAPYWSANLTYRMGERLLLTASHEVTVTTQQQQINAALNGLTRDSLGRLVDPTTGLPMDPNHLPFIFTNQPYTLQTSQLTVSGDYGRNRFEANVQYLQRDVGALGLNQSGITNQSVIGGSANYTRQLSRESDGSAMFGVYQTYDRDPTGANTIAYVGLAYSYNFSHNLHLNVSIRHYQSSENFGNGFRENIALIGLHKEF